MTPETVTIPERSAESVLLERFLLTTKEGAVVTYDQLNEAAKCDVREKGLISRVVHHMVSEHAMVFYTVRKVGIKRALDSEIVFAEQGVPRKLRRITKRAARRLGTVNYDALSNDEKIQHATSASILGTIALFTSSDGTKRIKSAVVGSGQKLDVAKTLQLFAGE